jgi:hypothetical protein
MVNQELVNWIKSEKAQGYSKRALTNILSKQNYSTKEIQEAIQEAFNSLKDNKIPLSVSFTLLLGIGCISLLLVVAVLLLAAFSVRMIFGYFFIMLSGLIISYYIYHIKQKLNATEKLGAIFGIFSPTVSLITILTVLNILQNLPSQLSFAAQGPNVKGFSDLLIMFAPPMNPIATASLFYLFCNTFIIISIIKNKEYQTFLWYALAPLLFFILWLIVNGLTAIIK